MKSAAMLLLATAILAQEAGVTAPRTQAAEPADAAKPSAVNQEQPKRGADASAKPAEDTSIPFRSLPGHKERVTSVAYSPDGRWIATASWDGTARLWDAKTAKEVRRLEVPATKDFNPARLNQIAFSPDSAFVVTVLADWEAESVTVWDRITGGKVRRFAGGCIAFSPDGKHIASGQWEMNTGVIRLDEFATGKLVHEMRGRQTRIKSLTFSPDGKTLLAQGPLPRPARVDGGTRLGRDADIVRVWHVVIGKERRSVLEGLGVEHLALSPDDRTLAHNGPAGGNAITLRETVTGGERAKLTGPDKWVFGLAFSPDGRTLASAGAADGTVRLWDLPSGKEVGRLEGHRGWVLAVAFSPDGKTLVSGGLDKTAHIWDVSRITGRPHAVAERSPAELEADWKDLAGDAAVGYAALGRLVLSPERAVPFLGKQLQSVKPVDSKRIERLIAELDSDKFAVREQATKELKALGEHAGPALRKALAGGPSAEVRRRLETLVEGLEAGSFSVETVRQIRAVEALESIANPEARQLLDRLAAGPAERWLTQEAKAAADRLAKQIAVPR